MRLIPLLLLLFAACTGDPESKRKSEEYSAGSAVPPRPPGLSESARACLEEWDARSLPSIVQVAVPPAIGRQPMLRSIGAWNGDVVAFSWNRAFRADVKAGTLRPVEISNCPSVLDLGENRDTLFALCSKRGDVKLMTRTKGSGEAWQVSLDPSDSAFLVKGPLAEQAAGPWGRLAVAERAVAVVGPEQFWWGSGGDDEWTMRELGIQNGPEVFESRLPPDVAFLTPTALLVGWDHGEFGSWFYRLELDSEGAPTDAPELIPTGAVNSVALGEDGVVWVSALGYEWPGSTGQVLALEGRTVRRVLDESARRCKPAGAGLHLPQPAAIEGLALDGAGAPLVLAGDLGVFRINDEGLVPLLRRQLGVRYPLDTGAIMNDRPMGLVATKDGIFVASRSLGVFAFVEGGDGYELSQIVAR
jgi:hypothetical protein